MSKWWSLLTLCLQLTSNICVTSDDLIPYPHTEHTDRKRTHRYVRDCQEKKHGNLTKEFMKPKNISRTYELNYINYHMQYGHHTIVRDPLNMISVLEPLQPGSCSKQTLSYVTDSAQQRNCIIATNAGFFGIDGQKKGACLGNIISNGRLVQDADGVQNANFGIRKDGTVVIGYLSEEEVLDKTNPFVQLISGVGWVIRKGEIYLNQSEKAECKNLETTGSLKRFFGVKSARTLIGYDKLGHVHLVQFDGKTDERGVNLWEAATYLQSVGVINAINFDGGGSATFVYQSAIINYPSNPCADANLLCPKKVSTILCVHNEDEENEINSLQSLKYNSNRNYVMVIFCAVIIGFLLLSNVFLCNSYLMYRDKVKFLTSGKQQKEALRSLLEENAPSSPPESDEDEL
ncbi:N-acetylglucosamine-1-phosphodiester alpha-N-acetylglucosaminidase-like isoform X1 [Hydractinia symbiolongicarpus]|uniref:N-acetylglucosamine-1-phosphodiester alpha-N-acetylglucosaminidase-like isoform X1 n=1 Tax=Hydractinia symbiolongicarpus TaxID=13093 RepID=UPI00254D56AE|nr:N-acetylglucosamine-1-phosphodiester alpha-N-acetylglucosaminidase-like isoform X1 [Hydractinia symbiolongicarpus]